MPLAFDNMPGLAGNMLVAARNEHDIVASGPCLVLGSFIPEFQGVAGALANTLLFAFWRVYWLLLAIIRPGPAFNRNTRLIAAAINVNRLGVAFEACIAQGLNTAACSASVARKRLRRKAAEVFLVNPAPFLAVAADLYNLIMPPAPPVPVGGAVAVGAIAPANSVTASAATYEMPISGDGTFLPLADAEVILFPRFAVGDRGVGSGCDFFFETWRFQFTQTLPAVLANAIAPPQMAAQIFRRFMAHMPDEMLANCENATEARMAHNAAYLGSVSLNGANAVIALQHTDVMLQAITIDTPGSEILRMVGVIIQAVLGNVGVLLAHMAHLPSLGSWRTSSSIGFSDPMLSPLCRPTG